MVGWLFALLSYHSWVLFSSLTVTYVLYLNTPRVQSAQEKDLDDLAVQVPEWLEHYFR